MHGERTPKETVTNHELPALRAVMVFLLSGLGSGLGDAPVQRWTSLKRLKRVCYHPNEMTLSDVSPSLIHARIMKSTSPALHTNSSHSSPGVCCLLRWIDLARTNQRENPVGGVPCPANPVLNNEREHGKRPSANLHTALITVALKSTDS